MMTKIKWQCKSCGDVVTSNTNQHHKMDYCKCEKSAVDAEKEYIRLLGDAEVLNNK